MDKNQMVDELHRLGNNIRSCRLKRGLTQEKLAQLAGVGYKFLSEIERGKVNPSYLILRSLMDALQLEIRVSMPNQPGATAHSEDSTTPPIEQPIDNLLGFIRNNHKSRINGEIADIYSYLDTTEEQQARNARTILNALFDDSHSDDHVT